MDERYRGEDLVDEAQDCEILARHFSREKGRGTLVAASTKIADHDRMLFRRKTPAAARRPNLSKDKP